MTAWCDWSPVVLTATHTVPPWLRRGPERASREPPLGRARVRLPREGGSKKKKKTRSPTHTVRYGTVAERGTGWFFLRSGSSVGSPPGRERETERQKERGGRGRERERVWRRGLWWSAKAQRRRAGDGEEERQKRRKLVWLSVQRVSVNLHTGVIFRAQPPILGWTRVFVCVCVCVLGVWVCVCVCVCVCVFFGWSKFGLFGGCTPFSD